MREVRYSVFLSIALGNNGIAIIEQKSRVLSVSISSYKYFRFMNLLIKIKSMILSAYIEKAKSKVYCTVRYTRLKQK